MSRPSRCPQRLHKSTRKGYAVYKWRNKWMVAPSLPPRMKTPNSFHSSPSLRGAQVQTGERERSRQDCCSGKVWPTNHTPGPRCGSDWYENGEGQKKGPSSVPSEGLWLIISFTYLPGLCPTKQAPVPAPSAEPSTDHWHFQKEPGTQTLSAWLRPLSITQQEAGRPPTPRPSQALLCHPQLPPCPGEVEWGQLPFNSMEIPSSLFFILMKQTRWKRENSKRNVLKTMTFLLLKKIMLI